MSHFCNTFRRLRERPVHRRQESRAEVSQDAGRPRIFRATGQASSSSPPFRRTLRSKRPVSPPPHSAPQWRGPGTVRDQRRHDRARPGHETRFYRPRASRPLTLGRGSESSVIVEPSPAAIVKRDGRGPSAQAGQIHALPRLGLGLPAPVHPEPVLRVIAICASSTFVHAWVTRRTSSSRSPSAAPRPEDRNGAGSGHRAGAARRPG